MTGERLKDQRKYVGKELEAMSFAVNYHAWIVDEFKPYLGNTAAEVGAGRGDLTAMLLQTNLKKLFAFEPSSNLFPMLQEMATGHSQLQIFPDFFDSDSIQTALDSVLYINVLEHIEDDRSELLEVYRALDPGGYLLLFVPALSWLFSEADRSVGHFRRYSKKELVQKVQEAGFEINKVRYFDMAGVIPWYVNFVVLKNSFSAGSVSIYDKIVVPPMKFLERVIKPPIGKNILMVARKP